MQLSLTLGVEWSDWVIRLPGGGDGAETVFTIGFVVLIVYLLVQGMNSLIGSIRGPLFSLLSFFAVLAVLVAIDRMAQDDEPTIGHEIEEGDCEEQLLDTCPPVTEPGSGSP